MRTLPYIAFAGSQYPDQRYVVAHPIGEGYARYINVNLVGNSSNRDGLEAVVHIETDSMTMTQVHDGKSGYLARSSLPIYFGLEDEEVREIEVTWPSGRPQIVEAHEIEPNGTIEIEEPSAD